MTLVRAEIDSVNWKDQQVLGFFVDGGLEPHESLEETEITRPIYRSDTNEIIWDASNRERAVLFINTSRSKAIVGFCGGGRLVLKT